MKPSLTEMKRTVEYILSAAILIAGFSSCIADLGSYDYKNTNQVKFLSKLEGFSCTAGSEFEMTAPIEFSEPFKDEKEIDGKFDIQWYIDGILLDSGYRIRTTFTKVGGFALILKVMNKESGEKFISDTYTVESKSAFGWGWLVLCDRGDGNSGLSMISPSNNFVFHGLENDIEGGLGSGPKSLCYYYVLGSIPGSAISGLPKILVNQTSGSVTLDGTTLQKDKWLKDEFESGAEPEEDMTITGFAWKKSYYLICTDEGNVYLRTFPYTYHEIPYYGTYSSMPFTFDGGAKIDCFQGFQNVTYLTADEELTFMFDSLNGRFIVFTRGGYGNDYASYSAKAVILSHYDQDAEIDPSIPRIDALPSGTRCLAAGAYEMVTTDPEMYGAIHEYPEYVTLLDIGGTGDFQILRFAVDPIGSGNHAIVSASMKPFSGAVHLSDRSVIRMSSNFDKNPFFYFTDGDRKLYVYSMDLGTCALAYTAKSRITGLCPSPIVCEFSQYGGNNDSVNWRMAAAQEDGTISIIDVNQKKMVKLFEGGSSDLKITDLSGFGTVKDMAWATNYEGEY